MNLSRQAGAAALQAVTSACNNGFLSLYQGAIPPTPEAALSGNALLAEYTFAASAFPTLVYDGAGYYKVNAALATNPVTPTASGTAFFARAYQSDGATVVADLTVAQGWVPNLAVAQSQYIFANGNLYVCTTAGTTASALPGPTGNGSNVQDGTAYWMYFKPGASDILLTSATLSTSTPLNLPFLWLVMPCV